MSVAFYIVLKSAAELSFDTSVNGKVLATQGDPLEEVAQELGLRPLGSFFSADPAALEELLELAGDAPELPPEEWFEAQAGLATVQGLMDHLAGAGRELPHAAELRSDLSDFKRVLEQAQEAGLQWHLAVDA